MSNISKKIVDEFFNVYTPDFDEETPKIYFEFATSVLGHDYAVEVELELNLEGIVGDAYIVSLYTDSGDVKPHVVQVIRDQVMEINEQVHKAVKRKLTQA